MSIKATEEELKELENQLICPTGEKGVELAKKMNTSNIGMTLNSFKFLEVVNKNKVLELGHGNCGHLDEIFNLVHGFDYFGLEISEDMHNEAKNSAREHADFNIYDGVTIPYQNNFFDNIFTVNTIYFWSNPKKLISEIERVLTSKGSCVITFANKDFMSSLPFVGSKFTLFDVEDIKFLIQHTKLKILEVKELQENVVSKSGEQVERVYSMVKLGF